MALENMKVVGNAQIPIEDPVTQASAASLANPINYGITKYSGTNATTGFRFPRGFRGIFGVIFTAVVTGATGGTLAYDDTNQTEDIPMGLAWTGVVGKVNWFYTNGKLVYPSYIA